MHDLDRTLENQEAEFGDGESWDAGEYETEAEYSEEYEDEFAEELEEEIGAATPLTEEEEMELAAELLTVSDEAELDQFLGKLFKRVGRGFKKAFRPLGKVLRPLAKKLLPIAGGAVGTFFGGPLGGAVGGKLGSFASRLFEVDFESLPGEEQEMEVARRFVRLASTAAHKASLAPSTTDPNRVAKAALLAAARQHAPGLIRSASRPPVGVGRHPRGRSGRWIRRGGTIILLGA